MYELYTQPRPGHPRWALAASALLLLITVALAQALIQVKTREYWVPLEPVQVFPRGHLQAALPTGWQESEDDLRPGVVLSLLEQADRGRQLLILRGPPKSYSLPSRDAVATATQAVGGLIPGLQPLRDGGPGQIGGLPGWTVYAETLSPFEGGRVLSVLGRSAIGPAGQMVTLVLRIPDRIQRADRQLLEQISTYLELLDAQPLVDSGMAMEAAGIRLRPPAGARFISSQEPDAPLLRMIGGDGRSAWFLDVCPVPLIGGRTPADLVADRTLHILDRADLPREVETASINGREVARLALSQGEERPWLHIWGVRVAEEHALLLVGRHEPKAQSALLAACEATAAGAQLDEAAVAGFDVAAATNRAEQLMNEVRAGALEDWGGSEQRSQIYRLASPALTWGREVRRQEPREEDGVFFWSIDSQIRVDLTSPRQDMAEKWRVRADAAEHRHAFERSIFRRKTEMLYRETREAGSDHVTRELTVTGGRRSTSTPIGPTYAPEPVLLHLAGAIANDPEARAAVFEATDAFSLASHYWLLTPIGEAPLPGDDPDRLAPAVRLQRDFEPAPILLYYDRDGNLLAIVFDSGNWRELAASDG